MDRTYEQIRIFSLNVKSKYTQITLIFKIRKTEWKFLGRIMWIEKIENFILTERIVSKMNRRKQRIKSSEIE